jgi:L-ascorbate metabolism protein UlaG (beta-lactamase superfamily)
MDKEIVYGGHSTVLIKTGKAVILTDPNLSKRIWTIRRKSKPGVTQEQLEAVNLVLISHGPYDHLDLPTVKRLNRNAVVIVPKGLDRYFTRYGFKDVRTLAWWEQTTAHGQRIIAVPANHFKGRNPMVNSLYQGYVIDGEYQIYFAGDTGWFEGFKEIGDIFRLDIAMLPIGAYKPWSEFGHHMTPENCVKALQVLKAKLMIPIHWGAFRLSLEPLDEHIKRLKQSAVHAGIAESVVVLEPGESFSLQEV